MTHGVAKNKQSVPDKHGNVEKKTKVYASSGLLAKCWGQERQDRVVKGHKQGEAVTTTVSNLQTVSATSLYLTPVSVNPLGASSSRL